MKSMYVLNLYVCVGVYLLVFCSKSPFFAVNLFDVYIYLCMYVYLYVDYEVGFSRS